MKKRLLSILLLAVMILNIFPVFAYADQDSITIYLSLSKYGEIVKDKNEKDMAYAPIFLSGKSTCTIDDAFTAAHETYYIDGAEGYASSISQWGLGVDKLWGDTSGNFGYQVNGATETVFGPDHILKDGDHIDAAIYQNLYPHTESYSKFDVSLTEVPAGEPLELTLFISGYDEAWNLVFSPCIDAIITIDGVETEYTTDENGKVSLEFDEVGRKVISAKKQKGLNDQNVPEITAPVCVVDVKEPLAIQIIHNIAEVYSTADFSLLGDNLPWILADMAVYEKLFPLSNSILSAEKKAEGLNQIVSFAKDATKPGDIAKSILALRSLGYDAKDIYTADFQQIDIVERLCSLVDSGDEGVTNIYTLPYVMLALSQGENYATEQQISTLITAATESQDSWLSSEFGTDAMTPMILALTSYCSTDTAVKTAVDTAVEVLKSQQRQDGLIDGFEGYESASTGLAICALSALGINSSEIINGENSLIEGLLSTANNDLTGFPNAFATEQGFRGLLAWQLLVNGIEKTMYDFSDYSMNEANVTGATLCPVIFDVSPSFGKVSIAGKTEISANCFDLDAGTYTYQASASGYKVSSGTFEITADDVLNRKAKTITVALSSSSGGGGGSSSGGKVDKPAKEEDKSEEDTDEKTQDPSKSEQESQTTATVEEIFPDIKKDDWYYPSVQYVYENKLFNGTEKGFEPDDSMTRAMLTTVLYRFEKPANESTAISFADVKEGEWYSHGISWAYESNIITGVSSTEFAPDRNITREDIAVILYRYALYKNYNTKSDGDNAETSYNDFADVSDYAKEAMIYALETGIITGKTSNSLAPKDNATRAEVATMLMRFAKVVE